MPSPAQIGLIHTIVNDLGLTDSQYRGILAVNWSADSCKDLNYHQTRELFDHFKDLGWVPREKAKINKQSPPDIRPPADPDGLIEQTQQNVISGLARIAGWSPAQLAGLAKRIIKNPWPQTHKEGQKLIYALTSMVAGDIYKILTDMDFSQNLTAWEHTFCYAAGRGAEYQLADFIAKKNQRGHRTMPKISFSKLIEIIEKRGNHR